MDFHGDVFDTTTKGSAKLLAKLGGHGYDLLIHQQLYQSVPEGHG